MGLLSSLGRYLHSLLGRAAANFREYVGVPTGCYDVGGFVDYFSELKKKAIPQFQLAIQRGIKADKRLIEKFGNRVPYKTYDHFTKIRNIGGSDEYFEATLKDALKAVGAA